MLRFRAILFLSLQLFTHTEICQFVKIPVLVSHYKDHKASNKDITFFGFLGLHYFNGDPHDNTDMELPFKTNSTALIIHSCPSAPVPSITEIPAAPLQEVQLHLYDYYLAFIPPGYNKDIFQPPQFFQSAI